MLIELFLAFALGVLLQRVYSARSKGMTTLGKSWTLNKGKWYKLLHSFYCEMCPRRHYCKEYKKRSKSNLLENIN